MAARAAYAAAVVAIAAVLAPVVRDPPRDSYPLSTYPMFATDRGRISRVATVVGLRADGEVVRLSPRLIGGTDEVVLAVETVVKAVRAGADRSRQLCEQVATRVDVERPAVERLEVRVETHDAVGYFTGDDRRPIDVDVRATCTVER